MVRNRTKSRIALCIAIGFFAAAGILAYVFFTMTDKANPEPSPGVEQSVSAENPFVEVDWEYWKSINPDVIGWVNVPDTPINYPILQAHADDPEFYLHHDVYKECSLYGVPYLDASNETYGLLDSLNAVVFGHHMNDGTMFAAFANYSDKSFADAHKNIYVQTPDKQVVYEAQCVQIIDGTTLSKRTSFVDPTDYETWYQEQINNSVVTLGSSDIPESLITFCTCSYNRFSNERTLVLASPERIWWQSDESKLVESTTSQPNQYLEYQESDSSLSEQTPTLNNSLNSEE